MFLRELNESNIVLVLKKENAECMRDLRLIALWNVLYKIIAKCLTNKLKEILPILITENHSTFVPGRNISDNVLVAFEVLHYMVQRVKLL